MATGFWPFQDAVRLAVGKMRNDTNRVPSRGLAGWHPSQQDVQKPGLVSFRMSGNASIAIAPSTSRTTATDSMGVRLSLQK